MKTDKNKESVEKNMKPSAPKGMKDYLPEEQILRQKVLIVLRRVFEKYGYAPLETPVMEDLNVLTVKGGGGSEVGKEIFTLTDRAGRKLGLKYDLTVPLARVIASNPTIPLPFKRYQMERVWRQEFGTRTREFWQCDVDVVGTSSVVADAEMLAIAQDVFRELKLNVEIKYNSRKLLKYVLEKAGIPESKQIPVIIDIDKLSKGKGNVPPAIVRAIKSAKVTDEPELAELARLLRKMKVKATFDPTLARGLDYYTGPIFEVVSKEYKYSITGGGRFDNLLKALGGPDLPATGISFGLTRICEILNKKSTLQKTLTQLYVIPIKTDCTAIVSELRKAGINTDLDIIGRSPSKNLSYASKLGIPYVLLVGPDELKKNKVKLRNMKTGKEQLLTIAQAIRAMR